MIWATRPKALGYFRPAVQASPNEKPRLVKVGAFRGDTKRQSGSSCCKGRSRTSMWMGIGAARVASCETVYSVGFFPLLPRFSGSVRAAISCLRRCLQKSLKSNVSLYSQRVVRSTKQSTSSFPLMARARHCGGMSAWDLSLVRCSNRFGLTGFPSYAACLSIAFTPRAASLSRSGWLQTK